MNAPALLGALAASVAVIAHGVVGDSWLRAQLASRPAAPVTPVSERLFGPADVSRVVFGVTWHVVTVVFLASAVALLLSGFGALHSAALLRYIALLHVAVIAVGLLYGARLFRQLLRAPVPIVFFASMAGTAAFAWLASTAL